MTKLESLDKLREICAKWRKMSVTPGRNSASDEVEVIADAIQAEIDSRYMLLPVDADGVPIRVGDELHGEHAKPIRRVIAVGNGEYICDCQVVRHANLYHHVNPRTVEDVLREFAQDIRLESIEKSPLSDEAIAKYAAELQMRGDEE